MGQHCRNHIEFEALFTHSQTIKNSKICTQPNGGIDNIHFDQQRGKQAEDPQKLNHKWSVIIENFYSIIGIDAKILFTQRPKKPLAFLVVRIQVPFILIDTQFQTHIIMFLMMLRAHANSIDQLSSSQEYFSNKLRLHKQIQLIQILSEEVNILFNRLQTLNKFKSTKVNALIAHYEGKVKEQAFQVRIIEKTKILFCWMTVLILLLFMKQLRPSSKSLQDPPFISISNRNKRFV